MLGARHLPGLCTGAVPGQVRSRCWPTGCKELSPQPQAPTRPGTLAMWNVLHIPWNILEKLEPTRCRVLWDTSRSPC